MCSSLIAFALGEATVTLSDQLFGLPRLLCCTTHGKKFSPASAVQVPLSTVICHRHVAVNGVLLLSKQ